MKVALAAILSLALVGCGGSTAQVSTSSSVVGKWMLDFGASEFPPPAPPTVEFRADGTYTQQFADSEFDSTYEVKEGVLVTEAGIGMDLKKQFIPQNDNAGTLRLTEVGPPPTGTQFWRSVN